MTEHAVVIAGGGPTGLMLAGELALAGIDVVIVERRADQEVDGSRAGGLHSRTIEVLDQRGIAERFLVGGAVASGAGVRRDPVGHQRLPHPPQLRARAVAEPTSSPSWPDWVGELGVPILRGREVVGFAQDDTGVDVELSGDTSLRAEYLVGCDGGRSLVRKAAGIDFAGLDPSTSWMIAEVEMDEEPEIGMRRRGRWHRSRRPGRGRRAVPGRADGTARRTRRRAHPAGPPRGARRRLRDGLRGAQPDLDLPVHRHVAAGGLLPRRPCAAGRRRRPRASPAGRPGPQHRRAGRREPGMEAGPGGRPGHHPRASWTPTTPNGIRSAPGCCTTPWRRSRSAPPTTVTRPSATP